MRIFKTRDPAYGFIEFNEWEKNIINHPAFQRLRRIRQLGLTDMVYPGAMHTRFEHSLGVMHLATKMYDSIIKKDYNKRILKDKLSYDESGFMRDRQIVRLAALLHDIGHAPFSHAAEDLMPLNEKTGKIYRHEDYTVAIIKNKLREVIEEDKINRNYRITADEIADMIEGNPKTLGSRIFWKVLISSQLDADRCDYLLRDSLHIGVKYGIYDLERLLVTLALGKDPETGDVILGIEEGGWHVAESLIIARYQMFTQVYYHKTRRAYDYMLREALKDTIGKFPPPTEIDEFLKLDDYAMWCQMKEKNTEWFKRIVKRNHIRMVAETRETPIEKEIECIENYKTKLKEKNLWFWEDSPEESKSWYKIKEGEEIQIINKEGEVYPLSNYSTIVKALIKQFEKRRVYVKSEDKEKALQIKKEVKE